MTKRCAKCKKQKDVSEFHRNASRSDGMSSYCKLCNNTMAAARQRTPNARQASRARARIRREKLIADLGGVCSCCGENQYEFLQIDHINGDGAEHRRELKRGNLSTSDIRNRGLDNFRVLCANCNFASGMHGECPHAKKINP